MVNLKPKYAVAFTDDKTELLLSVFHLVLGIAIYYSHALGEIYSWSILLFGTWYIIFKKDQNFQVLYAGGYIVGSEVFLRMASVTPTYEFCKYGLLLFLGMGIFFNGYESKSKWYFLYLLALIPGLTLGFFVVENPVYSKLVFDFMGPLLLGVGSVYCIGKRISLQQINKIFIFFKWPMFACIGYLFIFNFSSHVLKFDTQSNFYATAHYGPNQVATVLGFAIFILFVQFVQKPLKRWRSIFDLLLLFGSFYLCFLTFSRGGTIVCLIICVLFLSKVYLRPQKASYRHLIQLKIVLLLIVGVVSFMLVNTKTDGLIVKRYADQLPNGKPRKESRNGRKKLVAYEIDLFLKNPVLGSGLGYGKENSTHVFGKKISTHNELSRLLAEHGAFGILAILILLITPLYLYRQSETNHIYFWCFYLFWLLTIVHSGLRISVPAFVYSLSLLNLQSKTKEVVI
ncbi:MAG: O-antigen ligase family protein [Bacteroidetes bacterium]|nr:O-antigen ligase family protein [Bacteroidota bacterium]